MKIDRITKEYMKEVAEKYRGAFVVDFSYHLNRFFYSHSMLSINEGGGEVPTGHIYGVLRMISSMRREVPDYAVILVMDGKDPEKKEINEEYKAGRAKKEYNIYKDTGAILEMSSIIKEGIYISFDKDKEADDTIYAIAKYLEKMWEKEIEKKILIVSSDKDFYQVVSEKVGVLKAFGKGKGKFFTEADVVWEERVKEEFMGVGPKDLVKFRALVGDPSDNIKGFYRFPKKLAARVACEARFTNKRVEIGEGYSKNERKWVDKVNEEYGKLVDNYNLMRLKVYAFKVRKPESRRAKELVERYKMKAFEREVGEING